MFVLNNLIFKLFLFKKYFKIEKNIKKKEKIIFNLIKKIIKKKNKFYLFIFNLNNINVKTKQSIL